MTAPHDPDDNAAATDAPRERTHDGSDSLDALVAQAAADEPRTFAPPPPRATRDRTRDPESSGAASDAPRERDHDDSALNALRARNHAASPPEPAPAPDAPSPRSRETSDSLDALVAGAGIPPAPAVAPPARPASAATQAYDALTSADALRELDEPLADDALDVPSTPLSSRFRGPDVPSADAPARSVADPPPVLPDPPPERAATPPVPPSDPPRPPSRKRLPFWRPRRSRLSQYVALCLVLVSLTAVAWIGWRAYDQLINYPTRPGRGDSAAIALEIPKGASFPQVLDQLTAAGVVPADEGIYFKLFVLHKGAANKTTAGPHSFRGDMTPEEILAELVRAQRAEETRVTIPEGRNILEVADILADAGFGTQKEILAVMRDPALREELGITGESLEGYIFPDTYKFPTKATPEQVLRKMVEHHKQVYAGLKRSHREAIEELDRVFGWGDREIVIMASLVEKETAAKHERPLIAGVFLNRLRFASFQPKRLETDPTIIYGCTVPLEKSTACQSFEGRIRRVHLRDPDNPYNTYTHEGLPPGPITNPGKAALESVLAPKKSRFLYFVSRNDKTHQFSKTMAEHEAAVEKYMRQGAVGDGSAAGAEDPG